jgi:hypothetical protein
MCTQQMPTAFVWKQFEQVTLKWIQEILKASLKQTRFSIVNIKQVCIFLHYSFGCLWLLVQASQTCYWAFGLCLVYHTVFQKLEKNISGSQVV